MKRGKCSGFSKKSRRRLQEKIEMLEKRVEKLILIQLMYHQYPRHRYRWGEDSRVWKRDLEAFKKRFRRQYPDPGVGALWVLGFQKRAPHDHFPYFHLMVFGTEGIDKDWLSQAWCEIVRNGNERDLTRMETIHWRDVCSLDLGNVSDLPKDIKAGRMWGIINRSAFSRGCGNCR